MGSFPGGSGVKKLLSSAGDAGSIPRLRRSPGEGNGNPLQYSCWEISWTGKSEGLQFIGSQKSQTQVSDYNNSNSKITAAQSMIKPLYFKFPVSSKGLSASNSPTQLPLLLYERVFPLVLLGLL